MKGTLIIVLILSVPLFHSCKKSDNTTLHHINCDGLITDTLGMNDSGIIFIPNAFSPNGDFINDVFWVYTKNIASIIFTIYDEQNREVFKTDKLTEYWSPVTGSDTALKYYYKLQAITTGNRHIGICGEVYRLTCIPKNLLTHLVFPDQLDPTHGFVNPTSEKLPYCP